MKLRLFFLLALVNGCAAGVPPSAPHPLMGKALELELPTDQGDLGSLPAADAPVTVVDFFSPTCVPCATKVPELYALASALQEDGARLVLVAVLSDSETTEDARRSLARWGIPGAPFLVDAGGASGREAGVRGLPATLILDRQGAIRWSASPDSTASEIVAAAKSLH